MLRLIHRVQGRSYKLKSLARIPQYRNRNENEFEEDQVN